MDFEDAFENENNPFAGSNHFLSNGIDHFDMIGSAMIEKSNETQPHTSNDILDSESVSQCYPPESTEDEFDEANTTIESISEQPTYYNLNIPIRNTSSPTSPILIKSHQINSNYKTSKTVYYKIENSLNQTSILRRYNDFKSLRFYLSKFYPYIFIPPIPEKHSFSRFITNPLNYKTDKSIIELRIRLLNYFLSKINENKILLNSIIFKKFLDPLINDWNSNLNSPPFTNLSSNSILLIQSQNPTKLSPYFSYLPTPPAHLLKGFNSNLNTTVFKPLEYNLNSLLQHIIKLEIKIKHIINFFELLKNDMIKFGGFLNIFSIIENQNEFIERFGNKIDLNFLNIEILLKNIIIKIKEPLTIIKNSLVYLLSMIQFRKLKELQLVYFKSIILKKQNSLKTLIGSITTQPAPTPPVTTDVLSPSIRLATENMNLRSTTQSTMVSNLNPNLKQNILKNISISNSEITNNLIPCYNELKVDVVFLSVELEKNVKLEFQNLKTLLLQILNDWKNSCYVEYLHSCIKVWEAQNNVLS